MKFLNCGPLDEFVMLSSQLIKISKGIKVEDAKAELDKAMNLISLGRRDEAARCAVKAYQLLFFASN